LLGPQLLALESFEVIEFVVYPRGISAPVVAQTLTACVV